MFLHRLKHVAWVALPLLMGCAQVVVRIPVSSPLPATEILGMDFTPERVILEEVQDPSIIPNYDIACRYYFLKAYYENASSGNRQFAKQGEFMEYRLGISPADFLLYKLVFIPIYAADGVYGYMRTGSKEQLNKIFVVDLLSRLRGKWGYTREILENKGAMRPSRDLPVGYDAPLRYWTNLYNWTSWFSPFLGTGRFPYSSGWRRGSGPIEGNTTWILSVTKLEDSTQCFVTGLGENAEPAAFLMDRVALPPIGMAAKGFLVLEPAEQNIVFRKLPNATQHIMFHATLPDGSLWHSECFPDLKDIPRAFALQRL